MKRLLLILTSIVLAGCGQDSTTPSVGEDAFDLGADQIAFYFRMNMTTEGIRTAELQADTAYTFESSRRHDLRGVEVLFYAENGQEAGRLTSRTAEYNTVDNVFIAREDVVLITQGPQGERRLETEELHYDLAGDQIWTDRPFVLHEDGRVSEGTRFRTDSKFQTWEVTGIRTQGRVSGDGGLTF